MEIRPLTYDDINEDFLATLAALRDTGLTVAEAKQVWAYQTEDAPFGQVFVAVENGRVIGTATLLVENKFLHRGGYVGHIEDVAVLPSRQRHGVGTALVKHLIEVAKSYPCYKVILDTRPETVPFYERLGFFETENHMRLDLT